MDGHAAEHITIILQELRTITATQVNIKEMLHKIAHKEDTMAEQLDLATNPVSPTPREPKDSMSPAVTMALTRSSRLSGKVRFEGKSTLKTKGGTSTSPTVSIIEESTSMSDIRTGASGLIDTPRVHHMWDTTPDVSDGPEFYDGLPANWPASLGLRQEFAEQAAHAVAETQPSQRDQLEKALLKRKSVNGGPDRQIKMARHGAGGLHSSWSQNLVQIRVLDPNSRGLVAFDTVAMLILIYELVLTPAQISWQVDTEGVWLMLAYMTCFFWIIDMCLTFVVGYKDATDRLVMEQPAIVRRYLQSWFSVDVLLIGIDMWVLALITLQTAPTNALRLAKMSRMFKLLRLARLIRLLDKLSMMLSDHWKMVLLVVEVFLFTMLINHFLSCLWFYVGESGSSDTGKRWVTKLSQEEREYDLDASRDYMWEYTTSFHWTLAQLTLGSHEVNPTNSIERLVSIVLMVAGLLYGSIIVSFFSSQVIQFVVIQQEQKVLISTLKRYLRQHPVSSRLISQIVGQVRKRSSEQVPLCEEDVAALSFLPDSLRAQLHKEIRMPELILHPLFQVWAQLSPDAAGAVCTQAMREKLLAPLDDLFLQLQLSTSAYCLAHGSLVYTPIQSGSFREKGLVPERSWISEAAIWCSWIHVGTAQAEGDCYLIAIDAVSLIGVLRNFSVLTSITMNYGRNFHARVAAAVPPYVPHYPDDVEIPFCNPSSLLSEEIGMELLHVARMDGSLQLTEELDTKLEKEVREGKCALQNSIDGATERLVSVVAVAVHAGDSVLMEVGTVEEGRAKIQVQLPGTKQKAGELPAHALKRVFEHSLWPFSGETTMSRIENNMERRLSTTFGIHSVYLRTEFHMDLKPHAASLPLECTAGLGPCILINGSSTELSILLVRSRSKVHLFAWVREEDLTELKNVDNLDALESWAQATDFSMEDSARGCTTLMIT